MDSYIDGIKTKTSREEIIIELLAFIPPKVCGTRRLLDIEYIKQYAKSHKSFTLKQEKQMQGLDRKRSPGILHMDTHFESSRNCMFLFVLRKPFELIIPWYSTRLFETYLGNVSAQVVWKRHGMALKFVKFTQA